MSKFVIREQTRNNCLTGLGFITTGKIVNQGERDMVVETINDLLAAPLDYGTINNAAINVATRTAMKIEAEVLDLTEELEQCKIELQAAYDRIHDLEAELESTNWDRPIH